MTVFMERLIISNECINKTLYIRLYELHPFSFFYRLIKTILIKTNFKFLKINIKKKNYHTKMNPEDLERLFLERIKPYEDRIRGLEESEKSKELEIITLKHAIENMHNIIETLKAKQGPPPAAAGAKKPVGKPIGKK